MTTALPILPTSVVGSHGLPGWVWLAREAMDLQPYSSKKAVLDAARR